MNEALVQSPPIQIMEKPNGFDPYRIPSSVFDTTKSQTPLEWSMASNESLFSIHVGNSSFSRDQVFLIDKSGELDTLWSSPPELEDARILELGEPTSGGLIHYGDCEVGENDQKKAAAPVSAPQSPGTRPSDSSSASTKSFAFPILTAEERSASVKLQDEEHPQEVTPPQQTNWFSCVCFRPRCC